MENKFELFGGCLGNGITVCNKAVEENGDYKKIAHISEGGRIQFYIKNPEDYIPDDAMKTIARWSEENEKKFKEWYLKKSTVDRYIYLLENIPFTRLLEPTLKEYLDHYKGDLKAKVTRLEPIFFKEYA